MAANRKTKYHEKLNIYGWPLFTSSQTENRFALCNAALCPARKFIIRFKNCYKNDLHIQQHAKLQFLSKEIFNSELQELNQLTWGGEYIKYKIALEGAFYPFVRCSGRKPIDSGVIWIGTRYEYPLIYVDNGVADWLCPYTKSGIVMTRPFGTIASVIENWKILSDKRIYPDLNLESLAM